MSGWVCGIELWMVVLLALLPLAMTWANHRRFARPEVGASDDVAPQSVSVLIPARNEQAGIAQAIQAVLASTAVTLEVVVLDDHSTDATAEIVREIAQRDPRVRLVQAPPLPEGWCGKQHACHLLARLARFDRLTWIDADVRLAPDALARMIGFHDASGGALVSGFPRQVTGTWLEALVIPLIPAVLVGYLPMGRMRASTSPAYGAGCGQWFMAWRSDYERAGGHAAIRGSRHDGVTLPRAFRRAGLMTDVCDATDIAHCRMYRSAGQVWQGLSKNATEAMASPGAIGVWTVLLIGGWVLPWVNAVAAVGVALGGQAVAWWVWLAAALGCAAAGATSVVVGRWFEQPWAAVMGRPAGGAILVALQWYALARQVVGRPVAWRGR